MTWTAPPAYTATSAAQPRQRGAALVAALMVTYSVVIGNPLSLRAIASALSDGRSFRAVPLVGFLKLSVPTPRGGGGRGLLADVFWPDFDGPVALRTMNLDRERHQHWIAANFRTLTMVLMATFLVHVVLKSLQASGFLGKFLGVLGAVVIAGAASASLSTLLFVVFGGRLMTSGFLEPLIGAISLGTAFGCVFGLPLALVVAVVDQSRTATQGYAQVPTYQGSL
jgi:hypothetical protein